tara:strand:+ start:2711 stop:2917 length:207 start_codon:yes stop_codon:yes gene_type:complete
MTLPKNKQIKREHIESMKIAVEQYDIRAIHPEKMEEFAEYLVQKLKEQNTKVEPAQPKPWRDGSPLSE